MAPNGFNAGRFIILRNKDSGGRCGTLLEGGSVKLRGRQSYTAFPGGLTLGSISLPQMNQREVKTRGVNVTRTLIAEIQKSSGAATNLLNRARRSEKAASLCGKIELAISGIHSNSIAAETTG